jgi:hypothetical protein
VIAVVGRRLASLGLGDATEMFEYPNDSTKTRQFVLSAHRYR